MAGEQDTTPPDQFPRGTLAPKQSPKYWAKEKDRYLRQLLIQDIEAITGKPLFVYFAQLNQLISHSDPDDIAEVIQATSSKTCDFIIQTPGGDVDATEKIISVLRKKFDDYSIIVPSWAKSAGTVIAISSHCVVMGINSELGPIDPQFIIDGVSVPCEFVAQDLALPQRIRSMATASTDRMKQLASDLLAKGMMSGKTPADVDAVISKISSNSGYKSHGAVIDSTEADSLGLTVKYVGPDEELWKKIWLLYCMYDYDMKTKSLAKVIEGRKFSIARPN